MNPEQNKSAEAARRQFSAVAAAYATSSVHTGGPDLEALVRAAALRGDETVLDLGCGAGHTALAMAERVAQVTALDVTPEMLQVAASLAASRGLTNISFRLADATVLPFEAASFDIVTSRYSAHHYPDPAATLREVARVLRSHGRFLLVDTVSPEDPALDTFYNATELLRDASHVRNCRISEWERLFREAGLEPAMLFRYPLVLDGESWVARMRTPAARVDAIRELFATATPMANEVFALKQGEGWGWTIPVVLIAGAKDEG